MEVKIREIEKKDKLWIKGIFKTRWGSDFVISRGEIYYCYELDGFIAEIGGKREGLITYKIGRGDLEIVSLDSLLKKRGIGTALINKAIEFAKEVKIKRIWLITTNDNIDAIKFYQKRGFRLVKIYPEAVNISRRLKPSIPEIGNFGIPIRDEIEFEKRLN